MAKINTINNSSGDLTIDPGASGDSFVQLDINTIGEFKIGTDDTDDSFRISQGSSLGTNDTLIIADTGESTKPLQPSFYAEPSGYEKSNSTGDGTVVTMDYTVVLYDQTSDYDGTNTFTAPITGKYKIVASIFFAGLLGTHTDGYLSLITSNRTYKTSTFNYGAIAGGGAISYQRVSVICDMDASDTVYVTAMVDNGTKVVDLGYADGGGARGYFCATLIC